MSWVSTTGMLRKFTVGQIDFSWNIREILNFFRGGSHGMLRYMHLLSPQPKSCACFWYVVDGSSFAALLIPVCVRIRVSHIHPCTSRAPFGQVSRRHHDQRRLRLSPVSCLPSSGSRPAYRFASSTADFYGRGRRRARRVTCGVFSLTHDKRRFDGNQTAT